MSKHLGTTTVVQVGVIVRDVETRAQTWADVFGLPVPKVITTDKVDLAHTEYQGEPSEARAKLAFFDLGQVALELIEPYGSGPSTWRDYLEEHGEGIHHIAFEVKGMSDQVTYLSSKGIPLIQRGEYTGGRYAYVDSNQQLGMILELLEHD